MNPGSEPTSYGDTQLWLNEAAQDYGSIRPGNFSILTNTGPLQQTGQVQEFIVQTPEPGVLVLLLCGLLAIAFQMNRNHMTG